VHEWRGGGASPPPPLPDGRQSVLGRVKADLTWLGWHGGLRRTMRVRCGSLAVT